MTCRRLALTKQIRRANRPNGVSENQQPVFQSLEPWFPGSRTLFRVSFRGGVRVPILVSFNILAALPMIPGLLFRVPVFRPNPTSIFNDFETPNSPQKDAKMEPK